MTYEPTEYGEPWSFDSADAQWVTDNDGNYLIATHTPSYSSIDDPEALATLQRDRRALARTVLCVNLLAGVPDAALADPSPALSMFLAYLRGDVAAACAFADKVRE